MKKHSGITIIKWLGIITGGILVIMLILIVAGVLLAPDYSRKKTPGGYLINQSVYLTLDDNTSVFVDIWLPEKLEKVKQ